MGAQPSKSKRVTRSVSFTGSQRDTYRDFDVQLFKIDCEVKFTPKLECDKISEIKQKLYCLRQEFDMSRMKDKYQIEFRCKYRKVIENLESRIQENQTVKRKARKKRLAPSPPQNRHIEDFRSEIEQMRVVIASFHGRRDGDKHKKLQYGILGLLFTLTTLQTATDKQKLCMMMELLEMLKQLECKSVENYETIINFD